MEVGQMKRWLTEKKCIIGWDVRLSLNDHHISEVHKKGLEIYYKLYVGPARFKGNPITRLAL